MSFAGAREAGRRVAGVAAAARVAAALADDGFAGMRLVLPEGETLAEAAWRDLVRLGGGMRIVVAPAGDPLAAGAFDGAALVPSGAAVLRATGKASDGPVSRWLNRPVSRLLSTMLLRVPGIRPVHASLGTALLASLMFVALAAGGSGGLIVGALLFQAASIFDGVDGEIARATLRASHSGAVLDSVVDVATNFAFLAGLTVNLVLAGSRTAFAFSAWGFALFALGLSIIAWRAARAHGPFSLDLVKHQYRSRFPGAAVGLAIRLLTVAASRDFFALLFAVLVIAGWPMAVLYLFAAAALVWMLFVLGSIRLPLDAAPAAQRG